MRIIKAESILIEKLTQLEKEAFEHEPWQEKDFRYEIEENPFATIYTLMEDEEVVGYCDLWITYEQAQIANIAIHPQHMRKGYGTYLLEYVQNEAIKEECENLTLEVRVSNEKAIHLYEKFGFIKVASRKNYYKNGEDADLMIKPIGGLEYDDAISTRIKL